ncbi:MAG: hypothetical protein ACK523_20315, partial [Pirellulaceae bacterium]
LRRIPVSLRVATRTPAAGEPPLKLEPLEPFGCVEDDKVPGSPRNHSARQKPWQGNLPSHR